MTQQRAQMQVDSVAEMRPSESGRVSSCAEWYEQGREPQEVCDCGHYAAVHTFDRCSRCASGQVLSSTDPEPPVGTWVRDKYGDLYECISTGRRGWSPREEDGSPLNGDSESWTRVAGNQGPVVVVPHPKAGEQRD
jgi:hypothetical protein